MYKITQLLGNITYLEALLSADDATIIDLVYDTRKVYNGGNALFFALINQRDGHDYIEEAYAKGVRNFVVSKKELQIKAYSDCNFIWVGDTLKAMQEIAAFHRDQFSYPIIGITGSNGKTIVKEWLYQLLSPEYNCYQSPKSYNSQFGVALSLWQLSRDYDLAIIEAGISKVGEMDNLAKMIKPTVGVLTSLGTAHREGFSSKGEKASEKWKLFDSAARIIAPASAINNSITIDNRVVLWGCSSDLFIDLTEVSIRLKETYVFFIFNFAKFVIKLPFVDQASIDNVLTCITVMFALGYSGDTIAERIIKLKPLEMRLQLKRGKDNCSIIDDSYSNDLASLQIALDFLNQQNQHQKKVLILSDFEGEEWTNKFEIRLLRLFANVDLAELHLIGPNYAALSDKLPKASFYSTTADFNSSLATFNLHNSTILIKGARKYQLEKIVSRLVEQSHETVLEINLKAIEHNIQQYRSRLQPGVKMMAMVKAFSYGSGSFEVANVLQFNKIDYLTVAFVDEGVALRKAGISLPIMVLSPHESTFDDLVAYDLEPEIYSLRILNNFSNFLNDKGLNRYPIHVKLDTGMHRLGFMPDEVADLLVLLQQIDTVKVASVFSHLVGAGDAELLDFTIRQINIFLRYSSSLEQALGYSVLKHICNTSGIVHHPEAHLDMVRLGIGLYGFDMAPKDLYLEEVSQLKTTITQIKYLAKEETVGYDRKGILYRDSAIATVKIGYADGYNRRFGNGVGKMIINGNLVPTIGNICMDMCMLDITGIDAREGDEVKVFPDVAVAAKEIGTIPYELLTGISSRVKRVYFYE